MRDKTKDIKTQVLAMHMLAQEDTPNGGREALRRLKDEIPAILEHIKVNAEITRTKYLALKDQGFTDKEALELSKTLF